MFIYDDIYIYKLICVYVNIPMPPSYETLAIAFTAHLDNPWLAHLQVLNQFLCICKDLISK